MAVAVHGIHPLSKPNALAVPKLHSGKSQAYTYAVQKIRSLFRILRRLCVAAHSRAVDRVSVATFK
jgi:hypothetical protein